MVPSITLSDLKIKTKDKRLITLVPNEMQAYYLDMLHDCHPEFQWREGIYTLRGAREDILKARQMGYSTLILGIFFLDTSNTPHTESVCLTDNGDRSEKLFRITHRFYNGLPKHKRHPKKYSSKREIEYSDIDSILSVGTAGTGNVGRGGTVQNVHGSERAFWVNGGDVETGLLESVPDSGNVFRETTANGYNEYYHERDREHRGDSVFVPRFFGWNAHREYRRPLRPDVNGGRARPSPGDAAADGPGRDTQAFVRTAEESRLALAHNLDDEQLNWRRWKQKSLKEQFVQEYPLTEEEAFLASGNPYFDRTRLKACREALTTYSPDRRDLVWSPAQFPLLRQCYAAPLRDKDGIETSWNQLTVYLPPLRDHLYIVTCDPAEGLTSSGDRDYCSSDVFDVDTWEQVAHLHGRFEPHMMGQMLAELGTAYNIALVGVLRNNHGHAVLNELLHHPHPCLGNRVYPRQLAHGCTGVFYMDEKWIFNTATPSNPLTILPGYPENVKTKPLMLDALGKGIDAQPGLLLRYPLTISEMFSYVHLEGGGSGGEDGCHDDCVSSAALAALLLSLRYKRGRPVVEHERASLTSGKDRG